MIAQYTIYAYSPTLNQRVRQFNLTGGQVNENFYDAAKAQQDADMFAVLMNQQQYLNTQDWRAEVQYEQLGEQTYVAAQGAQTYQLPPGARIE